jgi:very-short-patch-repair endonuclease
VAENDIFRTRVSPQLWDKLKPLARQKRSEPTLAENKLWSYLRGRRLLGVKFRRQHPIDKFIVDFYCTTANLAIEVDGPIHEYTREEDAIRQEFLENLGIRILRFTNDEVLDSIKSVLEKITNAIK